MKKMVEKNKKSTRVVKKIVKENTKEIPEEVVKVNRCPTGIPGFDKLCQGGFVCESTNIILGGPGTGKTTFLLQFLHEGAVNHGQNGAYISFEPEPKEIIENATSIGLDFLKLHDEGKCKFIKFSPETNLEELKKQILSLVKAHNIHRISIDPVNLLALQMEKDKDIRTSIFDLALILKEVKVTSLLAGETTESSVESLSLGSEDSKTNMLKFLADGLMNLYSSGLGGTTDRAIRIEKMRRTDHVRGPQPFQITSKGVAILDAK